MNAEAIFLKYTDRYDRSNGKIELKILHTLEVAKVMERLTKKLHLDRETREIAHICAVFHDIGRFEQVRRYDTFLDHLSVDHAELGCEVLKQEGFLAELPEAKQKMILTAIRNHNRYQIESGLESHTEFLCRLIRDADKCDIFRVFAREDMVDTMGETEEQVAGETITDAVYNSILRHECVKKEERKTGLDKWVSFLGFFFDMNFAESLEILTEEKSYRAPFDRTCFTDAETKKRVEIILEETEKYIRERINAAGI